MYRAFIYAVFCLVLVLLEVGCKGEQPFPESDSRPAILYTEKCGICHQAFHPQAHTSTGWTKVIPKMEKNAESFGIRPFLSEEEKSVILAYLTKHARKGF